MNSTLASRLQAAAVRGRTLLLPVAPLLARLVFGQAFVITGWGKLQHLDDIKAFFTDLHIPFPSVQAPMIAALEFGGGILLLLGLCTRTISFLLACTMVVALLTADGGKMLAALPFRDTLANVTPLPFLSALVWLMAHGGGRLSADTLVHRLFWHRVVVADVAS